MEKQITLTKDERDTVASVLRAVKETMTTDHDIPGLCGLWAVNRDDLMLYLDGGEYDDLCAAIDKI